MSLRIVHSLQNFTVELLVVLEVSFSTEIIERVLSDGTDQLAKMFISYDFV